MEPKSKKFLKKMQNCIATYFNLNSTPEQMKEADTISANMMARAKAAGLDSDTSFGDIECFTYSEYCNSFINNK